MRNKWIYIISGLFLSLWFSGCDTEILNRHDAPLLLLEISDWEAEGEWDYIEDVEIQKDNGSWTTIADKLDLVSTEAENSRTGYTFELKEGESYKQISFIQPDETNDSTIEIDINKAEAGMVYIVRW